MLYDFGARTASIDAQRYQLIAALPKWRPLISRYSPRAPISRARATLSEATLARQLAERDIAKAEAMLKQAAANEQTRPLLLDWETAPPAALDAATLLADRARAARWPSLSLAANTGRTFFLEDERTPSTTYSIGVNLSAPLFDGGRLAAQARAAERRRAPPSACRPKPSRSAARWRWQ